MSASPLPLLLLLLFSPRLTPCPRMEQVASAVMVARHRPFLSVLVSSCSWSPSGQEEAQDRTLRKDMILAPQQIIELSNTWKWTM
eukprot:3599050-Pyramimonas_sp.AAC.1